VVGKKETCTGFDILFILNIKFGAGAGTATRLTATAPAQPKRCGSGYIFC
jgi:hypothetical protein